MNDAMCMSNFELGISDEHEGIIILDDADPHPARRCRTARRHRRGTRRAAEHGPLPVDDRHRPAKSPRSPARRRTSPNRSSNTVAEKIDGKVKVEIADPKLCRGTPRRSSAT